MKTEMDINTTSLVHYWFWQKYGNTTTTSTTITSGSSNKNIFLNK